jgi:hypothetical protein
MVNPFTKASPVELISTADEQPQETVLTYEEEQRLLKECDGEDRRHLKALVIAGLDKGATSRRTRLHPEAFAALAKRTGSGWRHQWYRTARAAVLSPILIHLYRGIVHHLHQATLGSALFKHS